MDEAQKPYKLDIDELIKKLYEVSQQTRKETYQKELTEYLESKLSKYNIPKCEIMEIAQYAIVGTLLVSNADVEQAYKNWNREMKRHSLRRNRENENAENAS